MQIYFKRTSASDLSFYSECFQNSEFQYMLYGNCPLKLCRLEHYIAKSSKDYKFVCSLENHDKKFPIGFAHFYHNKNNQYTYIGGIHPDYFNTGLGALASIAALSLFYDIYEQATFDTGIYKHNFRSLRLHLAIGFVIKEETEEMYILLLNKESFNNSFVLSVKKRINYQLIDE